VVSSPTGTRHHQQVPGNAPVITTCETDETLAAASVVFEAYRRHYRQETDDPARTRRWLTRMVETGLLTVCMAALEEGAPPFGIATGHPVPASLSTGLSWQLGDLYVDPTARRRGVAGALVVAVQEAAREAGATRLSLVTETDNADALGLYERLGFQPVEGLRTLSVDLPGSRAHGPASPT